MALSAVSRAWRCAAVTLGFGFATLPAHAGTPEDGRRAYDGGNFTDAMGIWADLSRQGDAQAEFGLGLLYDLGNGTQANPQTAFFWYNAAAEAGLPAAEFNVAAMYDAGRGVAQSSENAAVWYAKAASHGHHRAQYDLGLLYEQGVGVPRNPGAAAAWLRDAAEGGISAARQRLKTLKASIHDQPTGELSPVTPVSPAKNATLVPLGHDLSVELVWTAPAEVRPVHYQVQVRELGGSTLRTVFTASVDETATVVTVPGDADFYVWNVDAVARDGTRALGDWTWFSVGTPQGKEQSVASAPEAPRIGH